MSAVELLRSNIRQMRPYESARRQATSGTVWLNANENPATPMITDAAYNRYPQPQPALLVSRMARIYGVKDDQVLITRGSDEGIDLLVRAFCEARQHAILEMAPCFGMYRIAAQIQGARIDQLILDPDINFAWQVDDVLDAVADDTRIVFVCSPNNPTGNSVRPETIIQLAHSLRGKAIVVVDEAYIEFASAKSVSGLAGSIENLVVLRTLSKAYGLAGLRCGALLASPELIESLRAVIAPYPLASPVAKVAIDALHPDKRQLLYRSVEQIVEQRERLFELMSASLAFDKVWPSDANFVLGRSDASESVYQLLVNQGVIVRKLSGPGLPEGCLRVTAGSEAEMDALAAALDAWEESNG